MISSAAAKLWSAFRARVADLRQAKRFGLIPILITGFPTRARCFRYAETLREQGIRLIEIVEPIAGGWASTTNSTIREAHRTALRFADPRDSKRISNLFQGSLRVVYEGNVTSSLSKLARESVGHYSILQLAIRETRLPPTAVDRLPLPTTMMVSANEPHDRLVAKSRKARWMIVCKTASETGGVLFPSPLIRRSLEAIRGATDVPLFCTFGIKDADTISHLRSLACCDGAIIGTAILERLTKSVRQSRTFISELCRAAYE